VRQSSDSCCRFVRRAAAPMAALAGVLLFAGCATAPRLETNSIRDDLNSGGLQIASAERRLELGKVEHLSENLPVCIAYRMPPKAPWLTQGFTDAIGTIGRAAKRWKATGVEAQILHSRFKGDTASAFPAGIAVAATNTLREHFPELPVKYTAIPMEDFRPRSNCGAKDTVFVDVDRLTAYRTDFPSDTAWSKSIHIGDVLFIRISQPANAIAAAKIQQAD